MNKEDLTKPFFKTYREGNFTVVESNQPNDQHGDQAFEYDFDGSQRKRWDAYIEQLEKEGRRGDLVHQVYKFMDNPAFDNQPMNHDHPLESYSMVLIDTNKL